MNFDFLMNRIQHSNSNSKSLKNFDRKDFFSKIINEFDRKMKSRSDLFVKSDREKG